MIVKILRVISGDSLFVYGCSFDICDGLIGCGVVYD